MKILVLNASPKGKNSTTVHTALYLQALHPEHTFAFLPVGQRIKACEKDFSPVRSALEDADLILFCYPVYTFLAPYQLHRLMELIKADGVDLSGKYASQITTSKHFYDVTAHRYVEDNCFDLGMKVVRGLSADMEDLLSPQGRQEARHFFDQLIFSCAHHLFVTPPVSAPTRDKAVYQPVLPVSPKQNSKDVVIVTNCAPDDENLNHMIVDFQAALPYKSRVVNLREFPFGGGCLGCFGCAITGKCVYQDGFDDFLRNTIQNADGFVYAFSISDHYTHSSFKCFDDRQFCNGHRTVTHGTPIAYLISGDYQYEPNLRMIAESRAEVGGNYLCGVATDEGDTAADIRSLAEQLAFAMEHKLTRPANFYGVGGMKIFRDLTYIMQGLMKADHKFYKAHGIYDFPQKQKKRIWQMRLVGTLLAIPSLRKKAGNKMTQAIIGPYEKVVRQAVAQHPVSNGTSPRSSRR
ncbi:MAG: NAD(P)H-dependent oxidoreductase [Clostridiales bacterium]|uniref:NAD(P)H-dependent oxidoreductase n=1 Tax=Flavonifractor porci TaxID=3133422 RepID=UPI0030AE33EE|nr:NAD(P)H-dependent oxidoreductase [Clostridiales bacterium]